MNCAVLNKANTYYINGLLQSFSSMVELWTNYYLHADTLSPFVSSFVTTMLMVRSRKVALDQSHLLRCLQNTIIKSGKHCFDLFKQQGMLVRSRLLYLKSDVGSHLMHSKCLQPI